MKIAVLGATGKTGRLIVAQALERGHDVIALARTPSHVTTSSPHLQVIESDVTDASSIVAALKGADVVISGLGNLWRTHDPILAKGAAALALAHEAYPDLRIVWMGAFGTGASRKSVSLPWRIASRLFLGPVELADKAASDSILLPISASSIQPSILTNGPLSPSHRTLPLEQVAWRPVYPRISRATVAAALLDEAETPRFQGHVGHPRAR